MSIDPFDVFAAKMHAAGLSQASVCAFEGNYRALLRRETGLIAENSITPVQSLPGADHLPVPSASELNLLLRQSVVIKLNGGLGTGMGLEKAKSLLEVRDGLSFLDLIALQIRHLRTVASADGDAAGTGIPRFLLMNSFSTSEDTREFMARYPEMGGPDAWELMQSRVPKINVTDHQPLVWPQDPDLEWCPPGHGDLYPSMAAGRLDELLSQGIRYAFVSNSDNLGATLDPALLAWFAASSAPFAMEVTRRTEADRKGGHLALRPSDGRFILRESAQCAPADEAAFQDISRHQFFNTNNLWLRLDAMRDTLAAHGGLIPLPMIRNEKTADPRDKASPKVYQLETAMGAAIESFPGAAAIEVSRRRFAPVKTTADLLIIRSDACVLTPDHRIELAPARHGQPPVVDLDPAHYKMVDGLDALTAHGIPSLLHCDRLTVRGPCTFTSGQVIRGEVTLSQ